jgi:resuscitation-promoting factor RpfA
VRSLLIGAAISLLLTGYAAASAGKPSAAWLAQAQCIHRHEGPWTANTGNGYFGGMQFAAATWAAMKGPNDPAFAHPGDPAYPFSVPPAQQLRVAWLVWLHDGKTWHSWGAVGAACARAAKH